MPRITPVDPAESEGTNREIFQQFLKERGNIPNMMRTMGHCPEHLRTMVAHFRTVMNVGTVPRLVKELIAVRVSRINSCDYCLASHVLLARRLGATDMQVEALLGLTGAAEAAVAGFPEDCLGTAPAEPLPGADSPGDALFSPAEQAALVFAGQMAGGTGRIPETIFARLRRHYSTAEIVEIAAVAGLFAYFNRFNNALEVEITR